MDGGASPLDKQEVQHEIMGSNSNDINNHGNGCKLGRADILNITKRK